MTFEPSVLRSARVVRFSASIVRNDAYMTLNSVSDQLRMNQTQARLNPIRRGCGEHRHSFAQLLFGLSGAVRCEMAAGAFDVSVDRIGIVPNAARHFFAGRSEDSRLLVVDLFLDDHAVRDIERVEPQSGFRELFEAPRAISAPADLRSLITCAASQLARMPVGSRLMAQQWATMLAVQVHRLLAAPSLAPTRSKRERFHDLVDARLATPPSNAELERHLEYERVCAQSMVSGALRDAAPTGCAGAAVGPRSRSSAVFRTSDRADCP